MKDYIFENQYNKNIKIIIRTSSYENAIDLLCFTVEYLSDYKLIN